MLHLENTNKEITGLVNDILNTANNYTENAIPLVNKLAEDFYQNPNREAWEQLTDLFEGIGWIIETLTEIDSITNLDKIISEHETWNEYVQIVSKLKDILPEMEGALESGDNILIGDLLLYEITPIFEEMLTKLKFLKPRAVDQGVN